MYPEAPRSTATAPQSFLVAFSTRKELRVRINRSLGLALLGAFVTLVAAPTLAQHEAHPMPADEVGVVSFANSGAPAAQADFLYGLAQLHNFEYEDALAAFGRALAIDPSFAMAAWGEAMTFNHPLWQEQDLEKGRAALAKLGATPAERLAKVPTEREKAYWSAIEILYGEGTKEERDFRYADAMAALQARFPDDVDAAAFHALSLLGTTHAGRDVRVYMRSAGILEEAWPKAQRHPGLAHYLIHSYDDPIHAPLGLRAARIYADVAPNAGHAQHMTSHIFLALGFWEETAKANETALAVMNRSRHHKGLHDRACGHFPSWLHYAYLQLGRDGDARRVLEACRAEATGEHAIKPKDGGDDPDRSSLGSYLMMWTRQLLDTEEWSGEIAQWEIDPGARPAARLSYAFARGFAAVRRGDLGAAKAERVRLIEARRELDAQPEAERAKDRGPWQRAEILAAQLDALIFAAEGKKDGALARVEAAAKIEEGMPFGFGPPFIDKPSHELWGELALAAGDPTRAAAAFEAALARAPQRAMSVAGLAKAKTGTEKK